MHPFQYAVANDVDDAIRAGRQPSTRYIAGGTTLLDLMKLGVEKPAHLVNITGLSQRSRDIASVTALPNGGVRLGALSHMSDVAWHPLIKEKFPLVSRALLLGASGQIRNMATLGGNVLQRTRCYYFRDITAPCNKREPGSGCSAIGGYNRIHAVLGTSTQCIATHPSDFAVALAACDAIVRVRGNGATRNAAASSSEREIRFADLLVQPGTHPERENTLADGDLIVAIDLPASPAFIRSTYLKVRDRASYAFALASVAAAVDIQAGTIRDARIALGGVGTVPWRSREAEGVLIGQQASASVFANAASAALAGAKTQTHNAFKIELAKRVIVRALNELTS